ncbi:polysaccharide polymerase, partial [Lactobacillus gallinarum]|nr:polysaccharide polymerase [Lactobacillus gallinarum]
RTPATIFTKLDKALSGRLNLNVAAFQNWGIHFLGQKVKFTTVSAFGNRAVNYNYIDSSYFQNLIVNGWAFTAIIIIGFMFLCIRTVKEKKDILAVALMIVAIHAMFDPQLIWPWFSPFSLFIGKLFPLKKLD